MSDYSTGMKNTLVHNLEWSDALLRQILLPISSMGICKTSLNHESQDLFPTYLP